MMSVGGRSLRASGRTRGRAVALALMVPGVAGIAACGGGSDDVKQVDAKSATVSKLELAGFGDVLATKEGKPVYVLTADEAGKSACGSDCGDFEPLAPGDELSAGPDVDTGLLETFSADGGDQVQYNEHPLYTYTGEGLVTGAGTKAKGGTWYLISPDGKPIETTAEGGY